MYVPTMNDIDLDLYFIFSGDVVNPKTPKITLKTEKVETVETVETV
jgi:hypothetical protein